MITELLHETDVARLLRIPRTRLSSLVNDGVLHAQWHDQRGLWFDPTDVENARPRVSSSSERPAQAPVDLLTPGEVARLFGVRRETVTRWVNRGYLTAVKTPGGTRRFRRREVEELRKQRY